MITRDLQRVIEDRCRKGKAIILIGARQVGKSTLFSEISKSVDGGVLSLNCDDPETRALLADANLSEIRLLIGNNKTVIVDEAQRVTGIGLTLKIIVDHFKEVQLLVAVSKRIIMKGAIQSIISGVRPRSRR